MAITLKLHLDKDPLWQDSLTFEEIEEKEQSRVKEFQELKSH